jgi:hypothetical protein
MFYVDNSLLFEVSNFFHKCIYVEATRDIWFTFLKAFLWSEYVIQYVDGLFYPFFVSKGQEWPTHLMRRY